MGKAADNFFFECDPEKNKKCNKAGCFINGGPCHMTKYGIYAKDPSKVKVILPADETITKEVINNDHS